MHQLCIEFCAYNGEAGIGVPVLRLEGLEWKEMEWMMRCKLYLSVEGLFEKRKAIWNTVLTMRNL